MAVSLLIILSVVVVFAGSRLYSQYREQVIRTEESQLLTMAGIVGNNLNSYMEQQLEEIDLFYSREGMPENVWAESGGINARTAYFLKENAGIYNWITVTEPDGTKFRYEPGEKDVSGICGRRSESSGSAGRKSSCRDHGKRNIGSDGMV